MAASSALKSDGDVLYRAGEDSDDTGIWDDTALIEAYDRAVNIIKNGNFKKAGGNKGKNGGNRKQHSSKGNGKRKKDKKQEQNADSSSKWQVGDSCSAVFTEDGEIYDATIISIDGQNQTCVVRYDSYENEEEQHTKDLILPSRNSNKATNDQGYYTVDSPYYPLKTDTETDMEWSGQTSSHSAGQWKVSAICLAPEYPTGHWHEAVVNSFPTPHTCQVTFLRSRNSQEVQTSQLHHSHSSSPRQESRQQYHHHHIPSQYGPKPSFPGQWKQDVHLPQHFAPNAGNFLGPFTTFPPFSMAPSTFAPSTSTHPPPPPMPPVPPHPPTSSTDQDEALASMLMSWYLSGYYTGYYKGSHGIQQRQPEEHQTQPDTTETLFSQPSSHIPAHEHQENTNKT